MLVLYGFLCYKMPDTEDAAPDLYEPETDYPLKAKSADRESLNGLT